MARVSAPEHRLGTPTQSRCARCRKPIQAGHENRGPDGKIYGSECIHKILDKANSLGRSE